MVPEAAWLKLKEWYNSYGFEYPRKVILRGYMESIEIHPQPCFVRPCDDAGEPEQPGKMLLVSRYATGAELLANLSTALEVPEASTRRLWIKASAASVAFVLFKSQCAARVLRTLDSLLACVVRDLCCVLCSLLMRKTLC